MKTSTFYLVIIAFVAATLPFATASISSLIVDAIEDFKKQMPCGFPDLGIPALAPFKATHEEVNIDASFLRINGVVDNFQLNGLNDFEIAELKVNPITSRGNFHFIFNNVNVSTAYDVASFLNKFGFTIDLIGAGPAKFAVKNIHIKGLVKYNFGIVSKKLKLKKLQLRTTLGGVESEIKGLLGDGFVNEKLNSILEETVPLAINENEDTITATIEALALPLINGFLQDMNLSELIAIIKSGAGGPREADCNQN